MIVEEDPVSEESEVLSVVDVLSPELVLVKLPVTVALVLTWVELPPTTVLPTIVVVELINPLVWMVVDMCTTTLLLLLLPTKQEVP